MSFRNNNTKNQFHPICSKWCEVKNEENTIILSIDAAFSRLEDDKRMQFLNMICNKVKQSNTRIMQISIDKALNISELNTLLNAICVWQSNNQSIGLVLESFEGYNFSKPLDAIMLASIFEKLVLNAKNLACLDFSASDFLIHQYDFFSKYKLEARQSLPGSLSRLPATVCIRCDDPSQRFLVFEVMHHAVSIKNLTVIDLEAFYRKWNWREMELAISRNTTLLKVNLDHEKWRSLEKVVCQRNELIAQYGEFSNFIMNLFAVTCSELRESRQQLSARELDLEKCIHNDINSDELKSVFNMRTLELIHWALLFQKNFLENELKLQTVFPPPGDREQHLKRIQTELKRMESNLAAVVSTISSKLQGQNSSSIFAANDVFFTALSNLPSDFSEINELSGVNHLT